jgi:DNA-binding MarR family transcriptional regulator
MDQTWMLDREQSIASFMRAYMGDVKPDGMELFRLVRMIANLYELLTHEFLRSVDVSGPRLAVLMSLWVEEVRGNDMGTPPTFLSRWQRVSKNTISSLLRGLEEQGLIERTLDREDRRVFRIRLTPAGRQLVKNTAPRHFAYLNEISAGLSTAERGQLAQLLRRLYGSLAEHAGAATSCSAADCGPVSCITLPWEE